MHTLHQVLRSRVVISAEPGESVLAVARRMANGSVGAIPVLDGERLVGVFSERDLMTRVIVAGRDPAAVAVSEVMTTDVVTASLDDRPSACEEKMRRAGCRHLPVVVDGRVIAMLSMRDLLRDEIAVREEENRELRAYIHQQPVEASH
jgi:CBS domain-containing protein